jgi:hypothetical protein
MFVITASPFFKKFVPFPYRVYTSNRNSVRPVSFWPLSLASRMVMVLT